MQTCPSTASTIAEVGIFTFSFCPFACIYVDRAAFVRFLVVSSFAFVFLFTSFSFSQFKYLMQPFQVSGHGIKGVKDDSKSASHSASSFRATVTLAITNRYDHASTSRLWEILSFAWEAEVDGIAVAHGDNIAPAILDGTPSDKVAATEEGTSSVDDGACGVSLAKVAFDVPSLLLPGQECWLTVTGKLREGTPWAERGHVVGHEQLRLQFKEVCLCVSVCKCVFMVEPCTKIIGTLSIFAVASRSRKGVRFCVGMQWTSNIATC